jgi:hypothetical protein
MFFSQDWRERIKTENPDAGFGEWFACFSLLLFAETCTTGEVGKLLGAKWKEMSDEDKKPYVDQAAKDKERADEAKAAYDVRFFLLGYVSR